MNTLHAQMLELAVRLAKEAGDIASESWARAGVGRKSDGSLVTDADRTAQQHILQAIAARFPDHAVCAEESVSLPEAHATLNESRYVWVIDPLDGTRNFVAGFPCVATSIAVLDHGMPIVGVVREHNLGVTYSAAAGQGATCAGRRFGFSQELVNKHDALIYTLPAYGLGARRSGLSAENRTPAEMLVGFASSKDALTVGVVQKWAALRGIVLRNTGSTAFQLALVAEGSMAAAFGKRVHLWDVAAGALLVREAGGLFTDVRGNEMLPFAMEGDLRGEYPFLAGDAGLRRAGPAGEAGAYERMQSSIGEVLAGLPADTADRRSWS